MDWTLLALAAFFAGMLESIAGGGALLQLSALFVFFPGEKTALLLGTNKLASAFGQYLASWRYYRHNLFTLKGLLLPTVLSTGAALLATLGLLATPSQLMRHMIIAVMAIVFLLSLFRKTSKSETKTPPLATGKLFIFIVILFGFYDGYLAVGSGTLLIFALTGACHFSYLQATTVAKAINAVINTTIVVFLAFRNLIWWKLGFVLAIFNGLGAIAGAQLAIKFGNKLVLFFLRFVLAAIIVKLIGDLI